MYVKPPESVIFVKRSDYDLKNIENNLLLLNYENIGVTPM